ncbi:CHAD domain-containing protein [Marichromatium bheemlicum]|uniref:CHAD domain-containing protein n=1 Tax=Marichromatium bheemlicum TaxID=365339 RepID=A0ABX1I2U1_9GAMM|nr:CHAD domain-containing protein [Marichromatium bheemlicum]NKN31777.1 CHAD domain-containing protein [Marichromatium bheemlicum]
MRESEIDYLLPEDDVPLARLEDWARGLGRLAPPASETTRRVYYDTFDWAVHGAGAMLACQGRGPRWHLVLIPLARHRGGQVLELESLPDFPARLPAGALREQLIDCCGGRRLLALMQLDTEAEVYRLLAEQGHTLIRFAVVRTRFRDPQGRGSGLLPLRLRVLPGQGERRQRARLLPALERALGLRRIDEPPLFAALAAVGRRPGEYSSKLDIDLDATASAEQAARQLLLALLAVIEANVEGARTALDPEFLHDLRVATRRTRSALGQLRGVFPEAVMARFGEGFAWLQQVTGPVRDLDVQLEQFAAQRAALPEPLRAGLDGLYARLRADHLEAQQALAEVLGGAECAQLLADWRTFLETPGVASASAPLAGRPVKEVVDARLRRLLHRLRREGKAIAADAPPEALHALRKRCKKLRYMMEFFSRLYPPREIRAAIRQTKTLLDHLGGFQDRTVQAARLRRLAERMYAMGEADSDTLLAIGALIGQLLAQQQRYRQDFAAVFDAFYAKRSRARLRGLFGR